MIDGSTSVPDCLLEVLTLLEGEQRVEPIDGWRELSTGRWVLAFDAILSAPATEFMPEQTGWCLIASFVVGEHAVEVFPRAATGIVVTFPHQLHNGAVEEGEEWRTGKVCLDRPEAWFNRDAWSGEPSGMRDRVIWNLGRLLRWIDAAATGDLRHDGDPFEMPPAPKHLEYPVVGFDEPPAGLNWWSDVGDRWGGASLLTLPGAQGNRVVAAFADASGKTIRQVEWGAWAESIAPTNTGVWIMLEQAPVVDLWALPMTWRQLDDTLTSQGVNLGEVLEFAGTALRMRTKRNEGITLLLGFPAAERVGEVPDRVHWLAIGSIPLAHRQSKVKGFRSSEPSRKKLDAAIARSPFKLEWTKTMNWSADQIRRRGAATAKVSSAKVVLLGAGALGGAVAENLVRMGNRHLTILDGERLEVGNLSRHVLGLEAAGRSKAVALASALNSSMIDARTAGYATTFPPKDPSLVEILRAADVVIDCTGSDEVLRRMAAFEWGSEKLFVSMSITWEAEGLLAYIAGETAFPCHDAMDRFRDAGAPMPKPEESTMEGIGCWHPIFPATAEDMRLWGSIASRVVREAIENPSRRFVYFRQLPDGQIKIERDEV